MSYYVLLKKLRKEKGFGLEELSFGLCSSSMLARIENGEREANKMLRDRLLDRLGLSSDSFEEYVKPSEYSVWKLRQEALDAFSAHRFEDMEKALNAYEGLLRKDDHVAYQFSFFLQSQKAKVLNETEGKRIELCQRALRETIPTDDFDLMMSLPLSVQEINVILELLMTLPAKVSSIYHDAPWNLLRRLLNRMEQKEKDPLSAAKIIPKAVYCYYQSCCQNGFFQGDRIFLLQKCRMALELLRSVNKSYYIVELLEVMEMLLTDQIPPESQPLSEINQDEALVCSEWKQVFTEVYRLNGQIPYMSDDTYLYRDVNVYCTSDLIRRRRKMMGFTQRTLAVKSGCSVRTIESAESGRTDTQHVVLRALFPLLGLSAEYATNEIISDDPACFVLLGEIRDSIYRQDYKQASRLLCDLENMIDMRCPVNVQFISSRKSLVASRLGELSAPHCLEQMRDALSATVQMPPRCGEEALFFTGGEQSIIWFIMSVKKGEHISCSFEADLMKGYYRELKKCYPLESLVVSYEHIMTLIASVFGDAGMFRESNEISREIIDLNLSIRRVLHLCFNIYNLYWNDHEGRAHRDNALAEKRLKLCISLSRFCKRNRNEALYRKKLDALDSQACLSSYSSSSF